MCAPDVPPPVQPRQAARAPDAASTSTRSEAALLRRQTISSMILTDQSNLGRAPTAGKPVLGA